jgi:hypothetical protein
VTRALLAGAALAALAGCGPSREPTPAPPGGVATADMGGPVQVEYLCSDKTRIRVAYGVSGLNVPNLIMAVRGKLPTLTKTPDDPTMPGTRYAADNAWEQGKTGIWVVRDQKAVLAEAPVGGGPARVLTSCDVTGPED